MGMFEGEMSGENVCGKMSGEVVGEGGVGERNVGIRKINFHLLERHINNKYLL